jgi:hypothetical protein
MALKRGANANARQPGNLRRNTLPVAAGEACVRRGPRSDEAVVKSADAVHQKHLVHMFYDGFAAERRLRQLLQIALRLN